MSTRKIHTLSSLSYNISHAVSSTITSRNITQHRKQNVFSSRIESYWYFVGSFGSFWLVLAGFGWIWVVPCFSNYVLPNCWKRGWSGVWWLICLFLTLHQGRLLRERYKRGFHCHNQRFSTLGRYQVLSVFAAISILASSWRCEKHSRN